MNQVRLGVIGCGGMASAHMNAIKDIPRLKFTACADPVADNVRRTVESYGVEAFDDGHKLIASGLCDAVLIATPHYFHPPYAIAALKAGLHVLTEKPVAVTAKAAAEVNAEAEKHPELQYAVMFQMRTAPRWRKARQLIESGALGRIMRVSWTITTWFRTQKYYDGGAWRATWKGEGGGVLTNQCPHNLDLLWWLGGTPSRITANIALGKYHDIEVEDEVVAMLEYPDGAVGTFITSTAEAPGTNLLEIIGDKGKLSITPDKQMEFVQNEISSLEFLRTSPAAWATPPQTRMLIEPADGGTHRAIHENFVNAILDGDDLIAPGVEGLHSVEIANAIIMSGLSKQPVDVPMDRDAFDAKLQELIKTSKARKA